MACYRVRRQAVIWANAETLSIETLETNFKKMLENIVWDMSVILSRPHCVKLFSRCVIMHMHAVRCARMLIRKSHHTLPFSLIDYLFTSGSVYYCWLSLCQVLKAVYGQKTFHNLNEFVILSIINIKQNTSGKYYKDFSTKKEIFKLFGKSK